MTEALAPATTIASGRAPELSILRGPRFWLRSFVYLFQWELLQLRLFVPILVIVQVFIGAGSLLGFGLLIPEITTEQALFLVTGSSVLPLLLVGITIIPQNMAQQKLDGSYGFFFALPVSRMAIYLAAVTVWALVTLPAMPIALAVGSWRYDLDLTVSFWAFPAALLVIAVGASFGFALGHAVKNPRTIGAMTNVLIFLLMFFSPVNFPAERLPDWLAWIHQWLPAGQAASLMRWALTDGIVDDPTRAVFTLVSWLVGSWTVSYFVITRRG